MAERDVRKRMKRKWKRSVTNEANACGRKRRKHERKSLRQQAPNARNSTAVGDQRKHKAHLKKDKAIKCFREDRGKKKKKIVLKQVPKFVSRQKKKEKDNDATMKASATLY